MPADYCGAFSIDSIDQFGTLEQILISFDDPIWNSANTCILYGDGSVTANASASANGIRTREGVGSVTADGATVALLRSEPNNIVVLVMYSDASEFYTFWKTTDGKFQYSFMQTKSAPIGLLKMALFVGDCRSINFNLLR